MIKGMENSKNNDQQQPLVKNARFYWELFRKMFLLSAFTLGGGYVIIPLMRSKFVEESGWLSEDQMLDYAAIGQSAPGSLAINVAILVGLHLAGLPGLLCTVLGTALPPLILLSALSYVYKLVIHWGWFAALMQYLQIGVGVLLVKVVYDLFVALLRPVRGYARALLLALILGLFALGQFRLIPLPLLIVLTIIGGALFAVIRERRAQHGHLD